MKCFNKNMPEFQELLSEFDNAAIVTVLVNQWQKANNTDRFPTVMEAKDFANVVKSLKDSDATVVERSVRKNLRKMGLIGNKPDNLGREILVGNSLEELRRTASNILKYLAYSGISPKIVKFIKGIVGDKHTIRAIFKTNILTASEASVARRGGSSNKLEYVINYLRSKFPNVKIQYVSEIEAKQLYKNIPIEERLNIPFEDVKSFYYKGQAVLIRERVDVDTAIEEVLHPFTDVLKNDNPDLYKKLVKQARSEFQDITKNVEDAYTDDKGFSEEDRDIEILTKALTQGFAEKAKLKPKDSKINFLTQFINWFKSLIERVGKFTVGKNTQITIEKLDHTTSLNDIVKALTSQHLEFDPLLNVQVKLRYQLNDYLKSGYNHIYQKAQTVSQKNMMDVMLKVGRDDTLGPYDQFVSNDMYATKNIVALDEKTHTYMNPYDPSKRYFSSTEAVSGKKEGPIGNISIDIGNDFDAIVEGLAMGKTLSEIKQNHVLKALNDEQSKNVYREMKTVIDDLTADGSIVLPQVTVKYDHPDGYYSIAGMVDLLVIKPNGNLEVIDLKTSKHSKDSNAYKRSDLDYHKVKNGLLKTAVAFLTGKQELRLSTEAKHNMQVNMYARMLQQMGYKIGSVRATRTYHVKIDLENDKFKSFKIEGETFHPESQNEFYLDAIMPLTTAQNNIMDVVEPGTDVFDIVYPEGDISEETTGPIIMDSEISNAIQTLSSLTNSIEKAKEVISVLKKNIAMGDTIDDSLENLDTMLSLAAVGIQEGGGEALRSIAEILRMINKELDDYQKYITDTSKIDDPEYAARLVYYKSFRERFSAVLYMDLTVVNGKSRSLLANQIRNKITALDGPSGSPGSVKHAVMNYVRRTVKEMDTRELTDSEVEEILRNITDISTAEKLLGNASFSKDPLLAIAKKIYHDAIQKVQDDTGKIQEDLAKVDRELEAAAGTKNTKKKFEFMLDFDKDGNVDGVIELIGVEYREEKQKLLDEIEGLEYILVESGDQADQKTLDHNLKVREKKRKFTNFMKAEDEDSFGNPIDGEYHRYSKEFKQERSKYMEFVPSDGDIKGFWTYKPGISPLDIQKFERKYYKIIPNVAVCNDKGIISYRDIKVVKDKYVEKREVTRSGKDMRSKKYLEMVNAANPINSGKPGYELAVARLNYYNKYIELYNRAANMIGKQESQNMMGPLPIVRERMAKRLFSGKAITLKLLSKVKGLKDSWNLFWRTDYRHKQITEDERGDQLDKIPVMFLGNYKDEGKIKKVKEQQAAKLNLQKSLEHKIDSINAEIKEKERQNQSVAFLNSQAKRLSKELEDTKNIILKLENEIRSLEAAVEKDKISTNLTDSLMKFTTMASNFAYVNAIEDSILLIQRQVEERETYPAGTGQNLVVRRQEKILNAVGNFVSKTVYKRATKKDTSNLERQFQVFVQNNIYGYEIADRTIWWKLGKFLKTATSLGIMSLNPFIGANNYATGFFENLAEGLGSKHVSRKALQRATIAMFKDSPIKMVKRIVNFKDYNQSKPLTKYEGLVHHFRMLDKNSDIRETSNYFERFGSDSVYNTLYVFLDAGEYAVQSAIGIAVLMDTHVIDETTNETSNLYDAAEFNPETGKIFIDPKWKVIERVDQKAEEAKTSIFAEAFRKKEYSYRVVGPANDEQFARNIRTRIRNINILIHGSYALEDKTVLENYVLGALALQFSKWIYEAGVKKWYGREYYNQGLESYNIGYYGALKLYLNYIAAISLKSGILNSGQTKKDDPNLKSFLYYLGYTGKKGEKDKRALDILKDFHRLQGRLLSVLITTIVNMLFESIKDSLSEEEELNPTQTRLVNALDMMLDSLQKNNTQFVYPQNQVEFFVQLAKSPIAAASRISEGTEFATALANTIYFSSRYYLGMDSEHEYHSNKHVFYQRTHRKGEMKLSKEFKDLLPILYTINKWQNYITDKDYYIPN